MSHKGKLLAALLVLHAALAAPHAVAERIKDLASVQGVRPNQLVGYGLVVGLDGSGDQTTQTPFTLQSMRNMLSNLGINPDPTGTTPQLKNVAAVMVTATLPPYVRPGQTVDVTVSSVGNAKSLRGGTLVMTPLKGADGQTYAVAQGNVLVGGAGVAAGGSSAQVNHLSAGRIPAGATVERGVPTPLGQGSELVLQLNTTDFTTANRVVEAVDIEFGRGTATALDARTVRVRAPQDPNQRVAFMARLEGLNVRADASAAKVILNPRTGSVVMNQLVTVDTCAVAHGNLAVTVSAQPQVSQPAPLSPGQTVVTQQADVAITQESGQLVMVPAGANLDTVVKALNAVGASPQDLLAILQAMKAAGALRAELEII